jgi:hypothetical protein
MNALIIVYITVGLLILSSWLVDLYREKHRPGQ